MPKFPFDKKPAFFPFVSAEVFFETGDTDVIEAEKAGFDKEALDRELDKILGLTEEVD